MAFFSRMKVERDMKKKLRLPQFWFSVTCRVLRITLSRLCIGRKRKRGTKAKRVVKSLLEAMEDGLRPCGVQIGPVPFKRYEQSLPVFDSNLCFGLIKWLLWGCCRKEAFSQLANSSSCTLKSFEIMNLPWMRSNIKTTNKATAIFL